MNDNNQLSTKSVQSLTEEYQQAVQKYGSNYALFLNKYPTLQNRTDLITSTHDAVCRGGMSLVQLDNYFAQGASEYWVRIQLIDLFMVLGAFESTTTYQFKAVASRIRNEYYHLTPAELTRYFYEFSLGDYGKLYVGRSVNPQDILIGLKEYVWMLNQARADYDSEKLAEKQRKELEESKKNAISWEEYCRRNGKDPTKNPLGGLIKKVESESKRAENGNRK